MSETMSEIEDEKIEEIVDKGLEKLTIGLELQKAKKEVVEESKLANKWIERKCIKFQKKIGKPLGLIPKLESYCNIKLENMKCLDFFKSVISLLYYII